MSTVINSKIIEPVNSENNVQISNILKGEIEGVHLELISGKGPFQKNIPASKSFYDVLLSLDGKCVLKTQNQNYEMGSHFIAKLPFNTMYELEVDKGDVCSCLLIRKQLDEKDIIEIAKEPDSHNSIYFKAFSDCIAYTEKIKSPKTINRMILPERLVPRFCMGTVETTGPDEVGAHKHPMLEQLFLGLPECDCNVYADDTSITLTENMIIHIPLGSNHSVKVKEGKKLSYIWLDFFKTIEGQNYISEEHKTE